METVPGRDVIVIAASAGGIEALSVVLSRLPAELAAAVLVVLHVPATGGRALPRILGRAGALPAATAIDGEELQHGRVYVAPPDHHLLVHDGLVRVSHGPRQHGHRPAADPLFRSAAADLGARVAAVVLSGTLDDGAAGCDAVERSGGIVAVQDPADCAYNGMPLAALAATRSAVALPAAGLAEFLVRQTRTPAEAFPPVSGIGPESHLAPEPVAAAPPGEWSGITCPECGGPLNRQPGTAPERYVCRLGHGWSAASLLDGQTGAVERALCSAALRLEERFRLIDKMARDAAERGHRNSAAYFSASARNTGEALATVRALLEHISTAEAESTSDASESADQA